MDTNRYRCIYNYFLGYTLLSKDTSIITEIKGVIKLFYFPIVLTGVFILNEKIAWRFLITF